MCGAWTEGERERVFGGERSTPGQKLQGPDPWSALCWTATTACAKARQGGVQNPELQLRVTMKEESRAGSGLNAQQRPWPLA